MPMHNWTRVEPGIPLRPLTSEPFPFFHEARRIVILDRFLHHAEIISIQGHSDRLPNRAAGDSAPDTDERSAGPTNGEDPAATDPNAAIPPTGSDAPQTAPKRRAGKPPKVDPTCDS